ncbi:MAG: hypothetical protein ABEJ61_05685 [Haloferacaceae archaeon]
MPSNADPKAPHELRAAAREALDEEQLLTVLEDATEGEYEPDPQAATALKEVAAEETARAARRAALRARLRGRGIEAEDVARTQEERARERRRERHRRRWGLVE